MKPQQVRALVLDRVDAELFAWSYDFVGDLAETVALIWPQRQAAGEVPSLSVIVAELSAARRAMMPAGKSRAGSICSTRPGAGRC